VNYYNYFTEIEEHFVRRRGKHLLVSPMDWSLIATWRDSGIPLHVALRGIDRAMDGFYSRARRIGNVNSLFYCHATVMEEYARHVDAHTGEAPAAPEPAAEAAGGDQGPGRAEILAFMNARISEIKTLAAKQPVQEGAAGHAGLERIVARLEEIRGDLQSRSVAGGARSEEGKEERGSNRDDETLERDLGILDEALVGELRAFLQPEDVRVWEEEARKELKIYRKRLPKETYQKITENFMRRKIHRRFEIGELSLFNL
jgi:hypothetical protein